MILYENELFALSIINGILYLEYRPNTTITLLTAKSTISKRIQIQADKVYPLFVDMRGVVDSDKAGRDYVVKYGFLLTKAVAIFVYHGVSLTITSFCIKRYKSDVPLKMFTDKMKAVEYLNSFK